MTAAPPRTWLLATLLVLLAATAATASPTDVQVELAATGGLEIAVPATTDLGSVALDGTTATAQLGAVTVTDNRGTLLGGWTATVTATDLTTGDGGEGERITADHIRYASGPVTAVSGVVVPVPGQLTDLLAVPLDSPRTAMTATGVIGLSTVTWTPTLSVDIPGGVTAGTYTTTVTHSVS